MMKRSLLAVAALATCYAGVAMAADLPLRSPPPAPYVPPPFFTWSGGYFGINAGYAFDYSSRFRTFNNTAVEAAAGGFRPFQRTISSDGFTGGGQVGYNYQFGAGSGLVIGFEADAAYTDLDRTSVTSIAGFDTRQHSDMDFLGTVRGRVGYAFDRFLVYGTGGFAYGDTNHRSTFFAGPVGTPVLYTGGTSGLQTGYTYGGGVEFAVPTDSFLNSLNFFHSSAVTIKAEYLHYDLGDKTYAAFSTTGDGTSYTQRVRTDGDLARIGINYKF